MPIFRGQGASFISIGIIIRHVIKQFNCVCCFVRLVFRRAKKNYIFSKWWKNVIYHISIFYIAYYTIQIIFDKLRVNSVKLMKVISQKYEFFPFGPKRLFSSVLRKLISQLNIERTSLGNQKTPKHLVQYQNWWWNLVWLIRPTEWI